MPLVEIQKLKNGGIVDARLAGDPVRPWGPGDQDAQVFDFEAHEVSASEFADLRARSIVGGGDGVDPPPEGE